MRVVVTGPKARTFKFVAQALIDAGHTVVAFDPKDVLGTRGAERELQSQGVLDGNVDAIVNLVGRYEKSNGDKWQTLLLSNLLSFAYTVEALLPALRESKGRVVAVSRQGHYPGGEREYSVSKAALGEFMHTLHHDEPALDVVFLEPQISLETDTNRKEFAAAVVAAVSRKTGRDEEYFAH